MTDTAPTQPSAGEPSMDVAIMGLPRCGTTLLSDLLSVPGRSVIISEPNIHGSNWSVPTIQRIQALLINAGLDVPATAPRREDVGNFANYFASTLYPEIAKLDFWGVKYVDLVAWWVLFKHYPPRHVLRSVRDLRDVALSSLDRIARLNLAFSDRTHMRDEAWVTASLGHNIYELMRLREHADRVVRYEDFTADPELRSEIAALMGMGNLSGSRANIDAAQRRRGWELAKHGDTITTASVARHLAEPPGPVRALAERIWRLYPEYSDAFGYDAPPGPPIADHPFGLTPFPAANPVPYRPQERWDWSGPDRLEPAFARRRARILAARNIPPKSVVLDLACGVPALRHMLAPGCRLIPCDVTARATDYRVAALGEGALPDPEDATIMTAFGLLEYADPDLPGWLRRLRGLNRPAFVSYHPIDDTPGIDRGAFGWLNHLTRQALQEAAEAAGFAVTARWRFDNWQALLRLSPR